MEHKMPERITKLATVLEIMKSGGHVVMIMDPYRKGIFPVGKIPYGLRCTLC